MEEEEGEVVVEATEEDRRIRQEDTALRAMEDHRQGEGKSFNRNTPRNRQMLMEKDIVVATEVGPEATALIESYRSI